MNTTIPAAAATPLPDPAPASRPRWQWLPTMGSWRYHTLLVVVGMLILGPLCGLTSAYMVFSLGFFVGGQVLAGILGSVVTFGYGPEGRHGANYIQTIASSVAAMSGMAVMVQALVWLGLPQPPLFALTLYMLCIGMFGAGVGMLYTPLLVDRMQLPFPSGWAVANILRALSDPALLRRSIDKLGGGALTGVVGAAAGATVPRLAALDLSMSTLGAGMVVGSRLALPTLVGGLIFTALMPFFISIGWLQPGEPFRKIAFLLAIGAILGAVAVDLALLLVEGLRRWRTAGERTALAKPAILPGAMSLPRLLLWTVFWGAACVAVGFFLLRQPLGYLLLAAALVVVFGLINGVASGISDNNPISAAFVITVMLMATFGLRDPTVGLMASAIVSIAVNISTEMLGDRSTGWRLGSSRTLQFRYQVGGILLGSVAAVGFAQLFLSAYPVLKLDQTTLKLGAEVSQWSSAGTYKLVGALRSLTEDSSVQRAALRAGVWIGLGMQALRILLKRRARYRHLVDQGRHGFAVGWLVDALLLPSPYALAFGAFINLHSSAYYAAGGVISSWMNHRAEQARRASTDDAQVPQDMSAAALFGGGLIAGEALAALALGISGLLMIALG